jgi:hypothetical protein
VELEHTGHLQMERVVMCTGTAIAISPGAGPQRGWTWEDGVHEDYQQRRRAHSQKKRKGPLP